MNDGSLYCNCGVTPMNGEGWAGSGCGEVFVVTWLSSFWGGCGESLTAWAVTTASYRVAEQVCLELSVIGRSKGQRFEKMRIGVDLRSEYIKSRRYVVWFREIQIARMGKLRFDESRIKMLKCGKCENQISILTYDIIVPLGNHNWSEIGGCGFYSGPKLPIRWVGWPTKLTL